jgi:uncharacterized protein (DUF302 family)
MLRAHGNDAQSRFFQRVQRRQNPEAFERRYPMPGNSKTLLKKFIAVLLVAGPATVLSPALTAPASAAVTSAAAPARGVIRQQSDYAFDETVMRLKADIADKGIRFFDEIDHAKLGASANLTIGRSTLLLFGNPPLGVQFLQANPLAGLDWPVRMLVTEDADGRVWVSWSDFRFVAERYELDDKGAQIAMAGEVAASIALSTRKPK